jgi:hypothetical protein
VCIKERKKADPVASATIFNSISLKEEESVQKNRLNMVKKSCFGSSN